MQTAQSNHSSPATSPLLSHPREEDFTHLYQNGNNQDEDENALLASTLIFFGGFFLPFLWLFAFAYWRSQTWTIRIISRVSLILFPIMIVFWCLFAFLIAKLSNDGFSKPYYYYCAYVYSYYDSQYNAVYYNCS